MELDLHDPNFMNYPHLDYVFLPRAQAKMEKQREYLNGKNPGKGDEFYAKMLAKAAWLSENYHVPMDDPKRPGMKRILGAFGWTIIYRVGAEIVIPTVLHKGQKVKP